MQTVYTRFFVNERTSDTSMLSIVLGCFFLMNTTGSCIWYPSIIAGAMPEASMVTILLIFLSANSRANSSANLYIRLGSSWWFRKLSTFRMPPGSERPS